jgi:hypothetical protein
MSLIAFTYRIFLYRPVIELLRMADADVPSTGKIYWSCAQLHEHASTFPHITAAQRRDVVAKVRQRWDNLNSDLHCAGFVLDPEFLSKSQEGNEVSFGLLSWCSQPSLAVGGRR